VLSPVTLLSLHATALLAANVSLSSLYLLASARTGDASADVHALAGLRVECISFATLVHECQGEERGVYTVWVENCDGLRQPLTPPPYALRGRPGPPPLPPLAAAQGRPPRGGAVAAFALAFCATLAALAACTTAAAAWRRRGAAATTAGAGGDADGTQLLLLAERTQQPHVVVLPEPRRADFHVFLSYRRDDWRLADAVQDKLRLRGLRVFKDVDGFIAGRPFDAALFAAVHSAPVFAPVVTLPSLRRIVAAAGANAPPDTSLAEYVAALYCRDVERSVRAIVPLLAGPEVVTVRSSGAAPCRWAPLTQEAEYGALLSGALPDGVPLATMALLDAALRATRGVALPAAFASLTVRQVLLGRAEADGAPAVAGVLQGEPFELACAAVRGACIRLNITVRCATLRSLITRLFPRAG
jgi:hypothetical protein